MIRFLIHWFWHKEATLIYSLQSFTFLWENTRLWTLVKLYSDLTIISTKPTKYAANLCTNVRCLQLVSIYIQKIIFKATHRYLIVLLRIFSANYYISWYCLFSLNVLLDEYKNGFTIRTNEENKITFDTESLKNNCGKKQSKNNNEVSVEKEGPISSHNYE